MVVSYIGRQNSKLLTIIEALPNKAILSTHKNVVQTFVVIWNIWLSKLKYYQYHNIAAIVAFLKKGIFMQIKIIGRNGRLTVTRRLSTMHDISTNQVVLLIICLIPLIGTFVWSYVVIETTKHRSVMGQTRFQYWFSHVWVWRELERD
jgi:hypothetical protein